MARRKLTKYIFAWIIYLYIFEFNFIVPFILFVYNIRLTYFFFILILSTRKYWAIRYEKKISSVCCSKISLKFCLGNSKLFVSLNKKKEKEIEFHLYIYIDVSWGKELLIYYCWFLRIICSLKCHIIYISIYIFF